MIQQLRSGLGSSCLLLLLVAGRGQAADRFWIDTSGGLNNWNDADNWNPDDDFAKAGDAAFFNQDATYTFIVQAPSAADNITFSDGNVTLGGGTLNIGGVTTIDDPLAAGLGDGAIVTSSGPIWDNVGDAIVGNTGFGTLTVNADSDFTSASLFIGDELGSTGEVNVDGVGSMLSADAVGAAFGIFIGNAGTGTMNITGGGVARTTDAAGAADWELGVTADGEGTLNINGFGSTGFAEDTIIGNFGSGNLNIDGGGVFNQNIGSSPDAFVASEVGSSGDVTVNGDGSQWLMARLEIGNLGDATLSVEAGGLVRSNSNDMVLGDAGGSGKVAVFGTPDMGSGADISTLDATNNLFVGSEGLGELRVGIDLSADLNSDPVGAGHAILEVGTNLRIGVNATNQLENIAYISGPNTTVTVGNVLYAGENGKGTLKLRDGATLTAAFPRVGSGAASNGTLVVAGTGTTMTATGNTVIGTNGTGSATVSDGAILNNAGDFWVGYQGSADGTLTIDSATVNATTSNVGSLQIGGRTDGSGGTGTLTVQNGGTLNVTDETYIGGNSTASGTLIVTGLGSNYFQKDGSVNDLLRIGYGGAGLAEVRDGGRIDAEGIVIGSLAGSALADLLVTGSNSGTSSTVDIDGYLYVGDARRGTMTVEQGAQVHVATSIPTERMFIGDDNAADGSKMAITGAGSRVDYHGTGDVSVGNAGGSTSNRAALEVTAGGVFSAVQRDPNDANTILTEARILVGDMSNGNGLITVDGAGSLVEASDFYVGDGDSNASGILDIKNGGAVIATDELQAGSFGSGVGTVNVDGATSSLSVGTILSLGDDTFGGATNGANGMLNVTDGATVINGGQAYIGHFTGSFGTATLGSTTADTSSWTIGGELTIAGTETSSQGSGFGVLNVNADGLVDIASNLRIRNLGDVNLAGGEIRVGGDILYTDAGSTFNFNTGTLRFTDVTGYTITAAQLDRLLGSNPTLTADQHIAVDGLAVLSAPLRLNGGEFSVGAITPANLANLDFDAGTFNLTGNALNVEPGGEFGSTIVIDGNQTINVVDFAATVAATGSLYIIEGGFTSAVTTNDGLVIVSNTTAVDFDSNDSGSGLMNNGHLIAIDSTIAGPVVNNGAIEIVGAVNFADSVSLLAGGSLGIDLNGLADFDAISVGGDALLDGVLNVGVAGFSLTAGNSFEILDVAGTLSGAFTGLADGGLVGNYGGVDLFIDYDGGDGNDVVLFTVGATLPGDGNGDGWVDGLDYLLWAGGFGTHPGSDGDISDGDYNDDGWVDGLDYLLWAGSFGQHSTSAVPEPGASVLLATGAIVLLLRRRVC